MKKPPIPVFGVPSRVRPNTAKIIPLFWQHDLGINWYQGTPVTVAQLEKAISDCSGERIPNDLLPALDPGDVVVLVEGIFWITREWKIVPLPEKLRAELPST